MVREILTKSIHLAFVEWGKQVQLSQLSHCVKEGKRRPICTCAMELPGLPLERTLTIALSQQPSPSICLPAVLKPNLSSEKALLGGKAAEIAEGSVPGLASRS